MLSDDEILTVPPPEAEARRHVQRLLEWKRQDPGIELGGESPRPIRSVAIVGVGMMGTAIAAVHVKHGLPVVVTDADEHLLASAVERIAAEMDDPAGPPSGPTRDTVTRLVRQTTDEAVVARCDLVLESVVEMPRVKQQVFARLEPRLSPSTILASNTSTIPIGRLAARLRDPGRFLGLHFFHPVRRRPLLEVVRGLQTSDQTVAAAVGYAKAIGKIPIVVADGPGFLVNRLLVPHLTEALELLLDGATIEQIEQAATEFGMAKGPIRLMDEIGLDTALRGGIVLHEAFPQRIPASPLLVAMIKAGRLGRKSAAGFFCYPTDEQPDKPIRPDPAAEEIIARWARAPRPFTPAMIVARLFLPMVLEATRILEEQKVRDPRDIDLGVLFGLGFPEARGGLLHWADTLGADRILGLLRALQCLGERARPTPLLLEIAKHGSGFGSRS